MNALAKLRAFGLLLAVACVAVPGCQGGAKTEGASNSTTVELVAFEVGDYVHAIFKDDKGTETSYYIGDYPMNYFLAAHIGKKIEIEVKTEKTFVEEANQEMELTKIVKASSGGVDVAAWWKKELESATEEELQKKYDAVIDEHNRSKMPDPDPVALSLGGWVFAVNQGGNWAEPGKDLDGKEMSFASVDGSQTVAALEYSDGPPVPSVSLKGDVAKGLFQVSGSRATFLPGKRIATGDAAAAKVAQDFAKSKGKTGKAQIVDGLEADLDGDGKPEQVLAISSGSTLESKKAADFFAVIVRTQDKTLEVVYESEFGEMRGPFTGAIVAAGDVDGDGINEFVVTSEDPWGDMVYVYQLAAGPTLKEIHSAGRGE
ncbi:MAG: hypothetical protein AMXMBFR81_08770 [Chthonomonas sp.]